MTEEPEYAPLDAPAAGRRKLVGRIAAALVLLAILATYWAIQIPYFSPGVRETDTAGYLILAERIAHGTPIAVREESLLQYQSHVWVENEAGEVLPKYPPGLSALMAVGYWVAGENGPYLVSPVCGTLALVGAFLLFCLWMSPFASLCAVAALAFNPMFMIYTGYPLAHAANTCALVWGMFFLWRWQRKPGVFTGIGAGLLLGVAPTVRPTSAVFAVVVVAAVLIAWWQAWRRRSGWPWLATVALAVGYAFFPILHMAYNAIYFGNPLLTGYALSDEQGAFEAKRVLSKVIGVFDRIGADGLGALFGLGLFGLAIRGGPADRVLRILWFVPLVVVYGFYYWNAPHLGMAFTRFFICLFPLLVGMAFAVVEELKGSRRRQLVFLTLMAVGSIAVGWPGMRKGMRDVVAAEGKRQQATVRRIAQEHLTDKAVVFADQPVSLHLGIGKTFTVYDPNAFRPQNILHALERRRPYDPRQQPARRAAITAFYTEHQQEIPAMETQVIESALAAGHQVAYILQAHQVDRKTRDLAPAFELETIHEWEMEGSRYARQPDGNWDRVAQSEKWTLCQVLRKP